MEQQELLALLKTQGEILNKLAGGDHLKTPANDGAAPGAFGPGGIFAVAGLEREVVTAYVRPRGLLGKLPWVPSVYINPYYPAITGVTADVGAEATEACADNPKAYLKSCMLTNQFGRYARDTDTIEINDVMLRRNRGDMTDLQIFGELLGDAQLRPGGLTMDQMLSLVTKSEMVTASMSLLQKLNVQAWQGNPANNNGAYQEMPGLDRQIATGQVDAITNTTCPALDSDVKNFNYAMVESNGTLLVQYLSMLEAYLYYNAESMGLLPLTAVLVMRPELWQQVSSVWPCSYHTYRCEAQLGTNAEVFVDGKAEVTLRDEMRRGMFIDINGRRYTVVTDTGIFEHNNINNGNLGAGQYASSIYFVPLTAAGLRTTYVEHVDYRAAEVPQNIALLGNQPDFWTDDGRFFWAIEYVKYCYKLTVKVQPRVVLRTPHLAGRIDAVGYEPLQHFRDPDPDSPYHADGGVSIRGNANPTYAVW